MKHLIAFLLLLVANAAYADSIGTRTPAIFVGGGFGMGTTDLTPGGGGSTSHFNTEGWRAEVGLTSAFGETWGSYLSVEGGQDNAINTYSSTSYMEVGSMTSFGAKAGLYFGPFTIGGGYFNRSLDVKSLSTTGNGYEETTFSGWEPMGFANLTFDVKQRFRTAIEAQYLTGTLPGSTNGVSNSELNVTVRVYLLF